MPDTTASATLEQVAPALEKIQKDLETVATKSEVETLKQQLTDLNTKFASLKHSADGTKVYERVQDDPDRGFKSLGHFMQEVYKASGLSVPTDERLKIVMKAPTGGSAADSASLGFSIPPGFSNKLWDGMNKEPDNLLAKTDQYSVEGESLEFLANAETSRATGSRWGAMQFYWLSEALNITSSKPKLRKVKLEPQEMGVLVYMTNKLLARSPLAIEQLVDRASRAELLFGANDAIINGTGVGKPLGILNAPNTISIAKETGQAAKTVVTQNIDKMWSRLHPRSRGNAVWYMNVDVEPQLQQLVQEVGTGGIPLYRPIGGLTDAPFAALKGRPVIPIEYCQTLGTVGDLILADLSAYATGTFAEGVQSAMSMHVQFVNAEMAFRFMYAVDGQPWLASAITPFNGSNTLSTAITLATRA